MGDAPGVAGSLGIPGVRKGTISLLRVIDVSGVSGISGVQGVGGILGILAVGGDPVSLLGVAGVSEVFR